MKCLLLLLTLPLLAEEPWHAQEPKGVRADFPKIPEGLEVTVWAQSPMLYNPTNIDTDHAGRIWVAEGVNSCLP